MRATSDGSLNDWLAGISTCAAVQQLPRARQRVQSCSSMPVAGCRRAAEQRGEHGIGVRRLQEPQEGTQQTTTKSMPYLLQSVEERLALVLQCLLVGLVHLEQNALRYHTTILVHHFS